MPERSRRLAVSSWNSSVHVVGLDPNVIVRAWPPPDDLDAEFVSYPLIEFDQADLLWRYSPDPSPDASTQVRPWLALVVLKRSEGTLAPPTADQPLAVLTVNDVALLPTQSEHWAWGHTQVEGASVLAQALSSESSLPPLQLSVGTPAAFSTVHSKRWL
jgi:hypothetical protein